MENLDEFLDAFKKELVGRGITYIDNPQFMAHHMAEVLVSMLNGGECSPNSSHGGQIDSSSETFGENLGKLKS